jgi:hypothetical protein
VQTVFESLTHITHTIDFILLIFHRLNLRYVSLCVAKSLVPLLRTAYMVASKNVQPYVSSLII